MFRGDILRSNRGSERESDKADILLYQAYVLNKEYQHDEITLFFYDDRRDILENTMETLRYHRHKIPQNITIHLYRYDHRFKEPQFWATRVHGEKIERPFFTSPGSVSLAGSQASTVDLEQLICNEELEHDNVLVDVGNSPKRCNETSSNHGSPGKENSPQKRKREESEQDSPQNRRLRRMLCLRDI